MSALGAVDYPLTALFVDCDSYFASVEQHLDPALRGRPVGVTPVMAESFCCIAASYEAKAFGVKTGTRISDARIIPETLHDIVWVALRCSLILKCWILLGLTTVRNWQLLWQLTT
jgi:hypothetical protein